MGGSGADPGLAVPASPGSGTSATPAAVEAAAPLLQLRHIEKSFPGVRALKGVSFDVRAGEVHCLVGENGAGKSTLIKVLAGAQEPDKGDIFVRGEKVRLNSSRRAAQHGLAFIFQELDVVETLTVADNMTLGQEGGRIGWGRRDARRRVREQLAAVGLAVDPMALMGSLSIARRQLVLIARALVTDASVIVMDEPTATLTDTECERLFEIIEEQRARGIAIVYVSHRLDEVLRMGDRITVLRDGEQVSTLAARDATRDKLVQLMIGRSLVTLFARTTRQCGDEVLRLERVSGCNGRVREVSLTVHRGEVVGLAGLVGSGRTELARMIFGAERVDAGAMFLRSASYRPRGPRDAIKQRLGLVPEERKAQGIVGALTVRENISMVAGGRVAWFGFVRRRADRLLAREYTEKLSIRTPTTERSVNLLSGGNQQKVVIAKWLATDAELLILDEPTRGVDVGAKSELFDIVDRLAAGGTAIIMISSELEEVVGFCDRVAVLRAGRLEAVLEGDDLTMARVMSFAA